MTYALIQDGVVVNLIWLYSANADDFPDAVPVDDLPVAIGDAYIDGAFYRNGEQVLQNGAATIIMDMQTALETLGVTADE